MNYLIDNGKFVFLVYDEEDMSKLIVIILC